MSTGARGRGARIMVVAAGCMLVARAAPADPTTCEREIAKTSAKYVAGRAKALQRCEDAKTKGKLRSTTTCTDDPQTAIRLSDAAFVVFARINAACGGPNRDCGDGDDEPLASIGWGGGCHCPDLEGSGCAMPIDSCVDVAACVSCIDAAAVDRAIGLVYRAYTAADFRTGDRVNVCQQAIGRAATKFLMVRARALARCWDGRLRGTHGNPCPDPGDGKTSGTIAKAEATKVARICKACGGAAGCDDAGALDPAAIGFVASCPAVVPFAGPGCGHDVVTTQDLVDCVDCVTSFETDCADVSAVPEVAGSPPAQCNTTTSTTSTTTTSRPATSTSIHATSTTVATSASTSSSTTSSTSTSSSSTTSTSTSTSTTTSTSLPTLDCPSSRLVDAIVTLVPALDGSTHSPVGGATVELDYPANASLPGSGQLAVNDPSDPTTREAMLDFNLYNGFVLFFDTDTALKTSVAGVPFSLGGPYPFVRARFDCTTGSVLTRAAFTCLVTDESDTLGGTIAPGQRPACAVVLGAVP
jgi:hypothetical protein